MNPYPFKIPPEYSKETANITAPATHVNEELHKGQRKFILPLVLCLVIVAFLAGRGSRENSRSISTATDSSIVTNNQTTSSPVKPESASTNTAGAQVSEEKRVFKHGFDDNYPPFSYLDDNNNARGFDVEVAQAVCDYYGWDYEAVPLSWDASFSQLSNGVIDCLWSGVILTKERAVNYLFSNPYAFNKDVILTLENSGIEGLSYLEERVEAYQNAIDAIFD